MLIGALIFYFIRKKCCSTPVEIIPEPIPIETYFKHSIKTFDKVLKRSNITYYRDDEAATIEAKIVVLVKKGDICISDSQWISPVLLNTDGSLLIDYRQLNEITEKEYYHVPFDKNSALNLLKEAKVYSVYDLSNIYDQIKLDYNGYKTAFKSPSGKVYQYVKCPFGLRNFKTTLNRIVEFVVEPYLNQNCIFFNYQLIIFGDKASSLMEMTNTILKKFEFYKLDITNCARYININELKFFGYVISNNSMVLDSNKFFDIKNLSVSFCDNKRKQDKKTETH